MGAADAAALDFVYWGTLYFKVAVIASIVGVAISSIAVFVRRD